MRVYGGNDPDTHYVVSLLGRSCDSRIDHIGGLARSHRKSAARCPRGPAALCAASSAAVRAPHSARTHQRPPCAGGCSPTHVPSAAPPARSETPTPASAIVVTSLKPIDTPYPCETRT